MSGNTTDAKDLKNGEIIEFFLESTANQLTFEGITKVSNESAIYMLFLLICIYPHKVT